MTEQVFQKKFRTAARGLPMSFHMPTQDILQVLRRKCADPDLTELPRPEECLKYLLRVHVRVAKQDLAKHLRQVHVRPLSSWSSCNFSSVGITKSFTAKETSNSCGKECGRQLRESIQKPKSICRKPTGAGIFRRQSWKHSQCHQRKRQWSSNAERSYLE